MFLNSVKHPRTMLPTAGLVSSRHRPPNQYAQQLPEALAMPNAQMLSRLPTLSEHLNARWMTKLPKMPLALTVRDNPNSPGQFEVQMHITADLMDDAKACEELNKAIAAYVGTALSGTGATISRPDFAGNPASGGGIGTFTVKVDASDPEAWKSVDKALVNVMRLGRVLQQVQGHVGNLALVLRDADVEKVFTGLFTMPGSPLSIEGIPGFYSLHSHQKSSVHPDEILFAAARLETQGHTDLAMLLLSGGLYAHNPEQVDGKAALFCECVNLATKNRALTDGDIDALIVLAHQVPRVVMESANGAIVADTCCRLAAELFKDNPELALDFFKNLFVRDVFPQCDAWRGALAQSAEACSEFLAPLVDGVGVASPAFGEDVLRLLSALDKSGCNVTRHIQAAKEQMTAAVQMAVIFENPLRERLLNRGFQFNLVCGADSSLVLVPNPVTPFQRSHAEPMLDYVEHLLEELPPHQRMTFCAPVLDFLLDKFEQLPGPERNRLLALMPKVCEFVRIAGGATSIGAGTALAHQAVNRLCRFTELSLLQFMNDAIKNLDAAKVLDLIGWAQQNRATLFAHLPESVVDAALGLVSQQWGVSIYDVQTHHADTAQILVVLHQPMAPAVQQLEGLLQHAAMAAFPTAVESIFSCYQLLTAETELKGHITLLRHSPVNARASQTELDAARHSVKRAIAALTAALKAPDLHEGEALDLYQQIIDFVADAAARNPEHATAWAVGVLDELSSSPVFGALHSAHPNAAAWPLIARAELELPRRKHAGDECVHRLATCLALCKVADPRLEALLRKTIEALFVNDAKADQENALNAFGEIAKYLRMAGPGSQWKPLQSHMLVMLCDAVHRALIHSDKSAMEATLSDLFAQLVKANPELALKQLDRLAGDPLISLDHPLLVVTLCTQLAAHFNAAGDDFVVRMLIAKAAAHMPGAGTYGHAEAQKLLAQFKLE
jgi:hypothetical protein